MAHVLGMLGFIGLALGLIALLLSLTGDRATRLASWAVLAAGCLWLAAGLWRARVNSGRPRSDYGEVRRIVSGSGARS